MRRRWMHCSKLLLLLSWKQVHSEKASSRRRLRLICWQKRWHSCTLLLRSRYSLYQAICLFCKQVSVVVEQASFVVQLCCKQYLVQTSAHVQSPQHGVHALPPFALRQGMTCTACAASTKPTASLVFAEVTLCRVGYIAVLLACCKLAGKFAHL